MSLLKGWPGRVVDGLPDPATAPILSWPLREVSRGRGGDLGPRKYLSAGEGRGAGARVSSTAY